MPRLAIACTCLVLAAGAAHADVVVLDFRGDSTPRAEEATQEVAAKLIARFPHPYAKGKTCDPNLPGTPEKERAGGELLPRITTTRAAVTRPGLEQDVFLIDYCPTGNRVPRTRRLIVLDADAVALDRELDATIPADEVFGAVDIDGDGTSELILTASRMRPSSYGMMTTAQLVRPTKAKPLVLGAWTAIEECSIDVTDALTHTVTYRPGRSPRFLDTVTKRHCVYPPAPPPPR